MMRTIVIVTYLLTTIIGTMIMNITDMCIYIYIYMYICIYIYMYTHRYVYIYIYVYRERDVNK